MEKKLNGKKCKLETLKLQWKPVNRSPTGRENLAVLLLNGVGSNFMTGLNRVMS